MFIKRGFGFIKRVFYYKNKWSYSEPDKFRLIKRVGLINSHYCTILQANIITTTKLVYANSCTNCRRKLDIGEVGQFLREHLSSHRSNIIHHCDKLVANRFNQTNYPLDNLQIEILTKIRSSRQQLREIKEQQLISKFNVFFYWNLIQILL